MLTILVCVKDDPRVLRLLDSLRVQTAPSRDFKVVVVMSGSDQYGGRLVDFPFDVVVARSAQPGLAVARNRGLAQVDTELFLTTDADCVAAPDLVEQVVAAFDCAEADVVGIGGSIEKYSRDTPTRRHGITINDGQPALQYLPASPLPYITGAHAAFRTEAVREVSGYDERFSCGEDVDLCYRLGLAGGRLEVNPDAKVCHEDRRTMTEHFQRFRWYAVDQALLFRMYRGGGGRRGHLNSYPWRRAADAVRALLGGAPALARGDLSGLALAGVTFAEAAGVLVGDIEGSVRHRVLYI